MTGTGRGAPPNPPPGPTTTGRVLWFPVRHHSVRAAALVADLIRTHRPAAVLVEGPSDFNPSMSELALDHQLPVSIYTWVRTGTMTRGAFYPFCEFSPEWQALRTALEVGARAEFIDLPWADMAGVARAENRFADDPSTRFITVLAERLGVDTFDDVWDELAEIPHIDLPTYLERALVLGRGLRPDVDVDAETTAREAFMAARVRDWLAAGEPGWALVVTGGFHTPALMALAAGETVEDEAVGPVTVDDDGSLDGEAVERGVALTPTSFATLDAYTGYNAGQPNPGYYQRLWDDRRGGGARDTSFELLADVTRGLRRAGQFVSPADLIAARSTAKALAAVRGHHRVWRTDLVDGLTSALVKDDRGSGHPLLDVVHQALRGDRVGRLDPGASQPPLTVEVVALLEAEGLTPAPAERMVTLSLGDDDGLRRSRLLHALVVLGIGGAELAEAARLGLVDAAESPSLTERWRLRWTPAYESGLVTAAVYGSTLAAAVARRLLDELDEAGGDLRVMTTVLLKAALTGSDELTGELQHRLHRGVASTGDLSALGIALSLLMRLYRYDPVLRTRGRADLGTLVVTAHDRGTRLLERLGPVPAGVAADGVVAAIATLVDATERVGATLDLPAVGLDGALAGVQRDQRQEASVRGAALGGRWLTGAAPDDELLAGARSASDPEAMGDFLAGLFALAREAVTNRPQLLAWLDDLLDAWADDAFLRAAPALRRAFTRFTPRERARIAGHLAGGGDAPIDLAGPVDAALMLTAASEEAAVFAQLERFGLLTGVTATEPRGAP